MEGFRVLTVDGDAAAREHLRGLLSQDRECELIGECSNAAEATNAIGGRKPDLMFVDVRTPDNDGFELIRGVGGHVPLAIVTSGHGDYALRAFEARAFDYLLKPLCDGRFRQSLGRAKEIIRRERNAAAGLLDSIGGLLRPRTSPKRIALRRHNRVVLMNVEQIDWIEAADNYVCLHCGGDTHILRETIAELEARLDPAGFVRVHRSAIVNIDRIKELQLWFRGDYKVILVDGTELTLTKTHREKLNSRLLLGSLAR